jgi:hypothetical protein
VSHNLPRKAHLLLGLTGILLQETYTPSLLLQCAYSNSTNSISRYALTLPFVPTESHTQPPPFHVTRIRIQAVLRFLTVLEAASVDHEVGRDWICAKLLQISM